MPRERVDLPGPHRVVQRKAMHQQQRQAGAAIDVPEFRSVDGSDFTAFSSR